MRLVNTASHIFYRIVQRSAPETYVSPFSYGEGELVAGFSIRELAISQLASRSYTILGNTITMIKVLQLDLVYPGTIQDI